MLLLNLWFCILLQTYYDARGSLLYGAVILAASYPTSSMLQCTRLIIIILLATTEKTKEKKGLMQSHIFYIICQL